MKSCLMRVDQDFAEFVNLWYGKLKGLGYKVSKVNITKEFLDVLESEDIEKLIVNKSFYVSKRIKSVRNKNNGFDFKI